MTTPQEKWLRLAAQLEAGEVSACDAAASIRELAAPTDPPAVKKKPGRPPGAKTKAETPAMKRAREFIDLVESGYRTQAAAKIVAADWSVNETTVIHDATRHWGRFNAGLRRTLEASKRKRWVTLVGEDPFFEDVPTEVMARLDDAVKRLRSLGLPLDADHWLSSRGQIESDLKLALVAAVIAQLQSDASLRASVFAQLFDDNGT